VSEIARFAVRFDEEAFAEDLEHATAAGREVAVAARRRLEREGIRIEECHPCLAEGPEGTALGGCVKVYVPPPAGARDGGGWCCASGATRASWCSTTLRSASGIPTTRGSRASIRSLTAACTGRLGRAIARAAGVVTLSPMEEDSSMKTTPKTSSTGGGRRASSEGAKLPAARRAQERFRRLAERHRETLARLAR